LQRVADDDDATGTPNRPRCCLRGGLPGLIDEQPPNAFSEAAVEAQMPESATPAAEDKPKQKLVFHACGASVGYNVAKFCWFNKPKFGGNIYCMDCQQTVVST